MKSKKGLSDMIGLFMLILLMLALAFAGAILVSVSNNVIDEFTPVVNDLGTVGDSNLTQNANIFFNPIKTLGTSMNWILGLGYAFSLFLIIALALTYRATQEKYLLVLFLLLTVLALMMSIGISNAYEDLSNGTDSVATGLQDQVLLSWLIINSPMILLIVIFIAGVIVFTGNPQEAF